jgi:hypothetical protein
LRSRAGFGWRWQFAIFAEQDVVPVGLQEQIEAGVLFLDLARTGAAEKLGQIMHKISGEPT